jgi:hypothetical protein
MIGPSSGAFPDLELARVQERVSWFSAAPAEPRRLRSWLVRRLRVRLRGRADPRPTDPRVTALAGGATR